MTSIIYIPPESLGNIIMNYNKYIQNILFWIAKNDELILYYILHLTCFYFVSLKPK